MNIEDIARTAHEANRVYCYLSGDYSQPPWESAPDWHKQSMIAGVEANINDPMITPEESHENWMTIKKKDGWKYGYVKDAEKKEHPCMVPYSDLPPDQKFKDYLFIAVVKATIYTRTRQRGMTAPKFDLEQLALNAYMAYGKTTDYKNFKGEPMPKYFDLPNRIQEAWKAAAESVDEDVLDKVLNQNESDRT